MLSAEDESGLRRWARSHRSEKRAAQVVELFLEVERLRQDMDRLVHTLRARDALIQQLQGEPT